MMHKSLLYTQGMYAHSNKINAWAYNTQGEKYV